MNDPFFLLLMLATAIAVALISVGLAVYSVIKVKRLGRKLTELEEKHSNKLDVLVRVAAQHDIFINDVKKRAEEIEKANRFRRSR